VPKPDLRVVNQPKEEDLNAWFARNMPPSLQPIAQVPGHLSGTGLRWCPLHPPGSRERARSRRATQTRITTPSRRLPLSSTGAYLCPEVAQCPPGRLPGHWPRRARAHRQVRLLAHRAGRPAPFPGSPPPEAAKIALMGTHLPSHAAPPHLGGAPVLYKNCARGCGICGISGHYGSLPLIDSM